MTRPKLEAVVCFQVTRDGDDPTEPAELLHIGRPLNCIKADIAERFKDVKFPWLNAVEREPHVEDTANRVYAEQFWSFDLLGQLRSVFGNLDVGDKLLVEVVEVPGEEWAECCKRGEDADDVVDPEILDLARYPDGDCFVFSRPLGDGKTGFRDAYASWDDPGHGKVRLVFQDDDLDPIPAPSRAAALAKATALYGPLVPYGPLTSLAPTPLAPKP